MKCPKCESEMTRGQYLVEGTWLRFLFVVGFSWQSLWFKPDQAGAGKTEVMESHWPKSGFHCATCGTAVIERGLSEPWRA